MSDFDESLWNLEVLKKEVAVVRDRIASLSPAVDSATKWNESVRAVLRYKVIDMDLPNEREAVSKRCLNALVAKLSGLKVECVSLRWARREV